MLRRSVVFFGAIVLGGCSALTVPQPPADEAIGVVRSAHVPQVESDVAAAAGRALEAREKPWRAQNSRDGGAAQHTARNAQPRTAQSQEVRRAFDRDRARAYARKYAGAIIRTTLGDITIEFHGDDAPLAAGNFALLAADGFYNATIFHRVIKDFMIQGGDPTGTGTGGPGYTFEDEVNDRALVRGAVAMANAGPDTNGSQFFIVTAEEAPWLNGKHTVFGRVTRGMDVVDAIAAVQTDAKNRPVEDIVIRSVALLPAEE